MVKLTKIESSAINAIGYNPDSQKLYILFHESGVYRYNNVPPTLFEQLQQAQSFGKFYNQYIRPHKIQYPPKLLLNREQVRRMPFEQIEALLSPLR